MYTIRNLSEKTKMHISDYAKEHNLTIAESIQQLVEFGLEYLEQHKKNPKKYLNTLAASEKLPKW